MKYKFIGDGMGVPGLAHEISEEEAEAAGVSEILLAAIENGSYVPSPLPLSTAASPQMSTFGGKNKEQKEVIHG